MAECPFKAISGLVGVLIGSGLSMLTSVVAAPVILESAGWVQAEAGLWVSALFALGVTAVLAHQPRFYARHRGG